MKNPKSINYRYLKAFTESLLRTKGLIVLSWFQSLKVVLRRWISVIRKEDGARKERVGLAVYPVVADHLTCVR